MSEITAVLAREILDSRGNPTVEVEVQTDERARARRRPERRLDRRARGARAARRRQEALRRQGRAEGRRQRQPDARARRHRPRRARPGRGRPGAPATPTARPTRPSWARTPSSACRWRSRARRADAVGLPLWRYLGGVQRARPADAADEHHQRRRARRQRPRDPGVHDRPERRCRRSTRRSAPAPRSSTR